MSRAEQRQLGRRRLLFETLETRRVLAGGVLMQNIVNPEDINYDGYATALDALGVVNHLNGEADSGDISSDVNGDGVVSPGDVLYIINRINAAAEKSGVPVETRIANLERALAQGKVPNRHSVDSAREILATLKNGGLPELGDRFRDGKMINLNANSGQLAGSGNDTEAAEPPPAPVSNTSASEPLNPESKPKSVEDPLDLNVALEDGAPDGVDWWNEVVDDLSAFEGTSLDPYVRPWLVDGLQSLSDDSSASEWLDQEQIDYWLTALHNNESIPMDILLELAAYSSTLGDLQAQIAQAFANLDTEAIMDYLPDLGIVVEAITPEYTKPEYEADYEAAMADWAAGDHFIIGI